MGTGAHSQVPFFCCLATHQLLENICPDFFKHSLLRANMHNLFNCASSGTFSRPLLPRIHFSFSLWLRPFLYFLFYIIHVSLGTDHARSISLWARKGRLKGDPFQEGLPCERGANCTPTQPTSSPHHIRGMVPALPSHESSWSLAPLPLPFPMPAKEVLAGSRTSLGSASGGSSKFPALLL